MRSIAAPVPGPSLRAPAAAFRLVSDARLAKLAAAGSDGAMAAIFERHHQALYRYCHSLVGNGHDAADALQNTMVKALRSLPGETRQIALRPWLYRIAHNESISLLRARRPEHELDAAAHLGEETTAGVVESRERLRSLAEDLRELTERQRAALLMRELGGLELSEVAEALGAGVPAIKQSLYEARRALQAMEEGRAMDCDAIRRTLSDGDRRALRGMRMRGHLRTCASCRNFEVALHRRPAQLAALAPTLPGAVAAAMLQGVFGGGGVGGLSLGIAGGAKATTGLSMAVKTAATVAVTATVAGGGAVVVVPALESAGSGRSSSQSATGAIAPGATARRAASPSVNPALALGAMRETTGRLPDGASAVAGGAALADPAGRPAGTPAGGAPGSSGSERPGTGEPATPAPSSGARPAGAGKPAGTAGGTPATPGGRPAGRPAGLPSGRPTGPATSRPSGPPASPPGGAGTRPALTPGAGGSSGAPAARRPAPPAAATRPKVTPGSGSGGRAGATPEAASSRSAHP